MESHVWRLAKALIADGHEITAITGTPCPDPLPGRTTVQHARTMLSRVPGIFVDRSRQFAPPFTDPIFGRMIRRVSNSWQPDIIHAHGWCAFSCYWPDSPPLVVTLHDHGLRCPKRTLLRENVECPTGCGIRCITCAGDQSTIKRAALAAIMHKSVPDLTAHADRFIAVSHSIAQRVAEIGITNSKLQVIPNFLDIGAMEPGAVADQPTALFVGPDSRHKGRSVAIEAFRRLPRGTARLVLVGNGAPVNVEGVSNLGYLRGAELWDQYRRASIVLVPSVCPEACPTVILEAMAHGVPVVGSRIGGIPDLVEHERSGLLVPPNDAVRLAESMHAVLTDSDLRGTLAAGARARALQFDTAVVVPQVIEVYAALIKTRGKSA